MQADGRFLEAFVRGAAHFFEQFGNALRVRHDRLQVLLLRGLGILALE